MTRHDWQTLAIATPDAVGHYLRCARCALVVPVARLPAVVDRPCPVAEASTLLSLLLTAARADGLIDRAADDTATVERFLRSL